MNKCVLVLSTHDHGGAGESAYRITCALRKLGYQAFLIVKYKAKKESFIFQIEPKVNYVPLHSIIRQRIINKWDYITNKKTEEVVLETDPDYYFFNNDESIGIDDVSDLLKIIPVSPDVIIAGWVSSFLNTSNLKDLSVHLNKPVYWLMTDMAPITGGCHYAWNCKGYTIDCSNCPAILTEEFKQKAAENLLLKLNNINSGNISVIAGSEWCAKQAKASTLFQNQKIIHVLNGIIDQKVFNNVCRGISKKVFGIPDDSKVIFTGSTFTYEKRKGIHYFIESLRKMYDSMSCEEREKTCLLVAGQNIRSNEFIKQVPFKIVAIDFIKDDRLLSLAYQASDVFVCSSIEDSGPMMVNEALACGTPVVGFDLGFVSDIVEHGKSGFRVPMKDTSMMAAYIRTIVNLTSEEADLFTQNAIQAVNKNVSLQRLEEIIDQLIK